MFKVFKTAIKLLTSPGNNFVEGDDKADAYSCHIVDNNGLIFAKILTLD